MEDENCLKLFLRDVLASSLHVTQAERSSNSSYAFLLWDEEKTSPELDFYPQKFVTGGRIFEICVT